MVTALIKGNANLDTEDPEGENALRIAAKNEDLVI